MRKYAIIVAGGNGSRMKSDVPKQFLFINDKPIIAITINQFLKVGCDVIVVLPAEHFSTFKNEMLHHCSSQEMVLAEGGKTRFDSVKNGLDLVADNSLVAIHDAVRPFVSVELIETSFSEAEKNNSAIASVPLKDSIRLITTDGNKSKDRANYRLIQTPQTFQSDSLHKAYNQPYNTSFTDDASVFEANGNNIHLIDGDYKNIKITTPEDLLVAKAFTE